MRHFYDIESLGMDVMPAVKTYEKECANKILEATTWQMYNGKSETSYSGNKISFVEFTDIG